MEILPLRAPEVRRGDKIADVVHRAAADAGLEILDGDIIAIASKIISKAQGKTTYLGRVRPSQRANRLGRRFSIQPALAEVILKESTRVYGGVPAAVLTLKHGILIANAGIDRKNAPKGAAALWPSNPRRVAESLRSEMRSKFGRNVGIVIVDSRLTPLRLGTVGVALATAGFTPIKDYRGKRDLEGRHIQMTVHSLADDLASAAHLVMGEGEEGTPIAIVRGSQIALGGRTCSLTIAESKCLYMNAFGKD